MRKGKKRIIKENLAKIAYCEFVREKIINKLFIEKHELYEK